MAFIFFDELGVEPVAFVGVQLPRTAIYSGNHKVLSDTLGANQLPGVGSSIHKLTGSISAAYAIAVMSDSIHKLYVYNKINAPVNPTCGNYLNTEEDDRYLDTPYDDRYLETPKKDCDAL